VQRQVANINEKVRNALKPGFVSGQAVKPSGPLAGLTEGRQMFLTVSLANLPAAAEKAFSEKLSKFDNKTVTIMALDYKYNEIDIEMDGKMFLLDWNIKGLYTLTDPKTGKRYVSGPPRDGGEADKAGHKEVGGIDMRCLPLGQPEEVLTMSQVVAGKDAMQMSAEELDEQWGSIEKEILSGPMPFDRLKAYAVACFANQGATIQREKFCSYIADILKLEEEAAVPTEKDLKELLVVLPVFG